MSLPAPAKIPRETPTDLARTNPLANVQPIPGWKPAVRITADDVALFSSYIYALSGICVDAAKTYLLETRLGKLLESNNCDSYGALYQAARLDGSKKLEKQIIDAITTNETLFFRDTSPFELLKHKIIPEVIDRQAKKNSSGGATPIRIWSAACSTGQEVISIAITLKEILGSVSPYSIRLLGTDLSDEAIQKASMGVYNKFEIERGLSRERLQRYFTAQGENWKIKDEIRSMASFQKLNLMQPFQNLGKFDVILCRNVAIYFTQDDRKDLFDRIASVLNPGGFLIIGATESLTGICPQWIAKRHLKSMFYQLK
jgi:chemotaxis protein methyltransferase CheR